MNTAKDLQPSLEKQEGMAEIPAVVRNAVFALANEAAQGVTQVWERYRVLARLVKRAFRAGQKSAGITRVETRIRHTARGWEVQFNGDRWLRPADLPVGSVARLVWDAAAQFPPPASPETRTDRGVMVTISLHIEVQQ